MLQDVHVIRFYGQRTEGKKQYLFLECAAGGELFDRIGIWMYLCLGFCVVQIPTLPSPMPNSPRISDCPVIRCYVEIFDCPPLVQRPWQAQNCRHLRLIQVKG